MYLSSYLWGNRPDKLVELVDTKNTHVALITNSADQFPEDGIIERLRQDQEYLTSLGMTSERLDLRNYFDNKESELREKLKDYGLVWIRGANVFVLRRAMRQSCFDTIIKELLQRDAIVYGGYSAGACVMGSTLHGLELVDDALIAPEGYQSDIIWDGLNILPYAIAPHYRSNHPESSMIDDSVSYFEEHRIPYKTLRDGEVIVINGSKEFIVR